MKITAVEPIVLRADRVDTTRADGTQDAFLLRIHTDEGHVGIGEADTSPYLARTMIEMPSSHLIARGLREVLHVISAIDMALWDLAGKAAGDRRSHEMVRGARGDRARGADPHMTRLRSCLWSCLGR